jgi:hypothetical protein
MKQATLENLHCTVTEDTLGDDECRVEIYADGGFEGALRGDLNNDEDWALNTSVVFDSNLVVKLFDEDGDFPGDDDDALGIVTIPASDVSHGTGDFTQDEANYRLTYSVSDRSDLTPAGMLEWTLQNFESSTTPGVWPQIDKAALMSDVRATVADPEGQVYQARAQFCGPCSIIVELAKNMPRRYVRVCQELYETGTFYGRSNAVSASSDLRATNVGQDMSPADWLLAATMRDDENAIFGVSPDSTGIVSDIQGMTTHWEMEGWAGEILYKDNTANSTTFVWGERDAITYAEQVYAGGGVAFVMIDSDLITNPGGDSNPLVPDHWVVYRGGLGFNNDRIQFRVWSWAQFYDVDVPLGRFEDCMFGTVTGF